MWVKYGKQFNCIALQRVELGIGLRLEKTRWPAIAFSVKKWCCVFSSIKNARIRRTEVNLLDLHLRI